MPGSTPRLHLPYPLPTDQVAEGATDIQALAGAVERAIQSGIATSDASGHIAVTFAQAFTAPPVILLTVEVPSGDSRQVATITDPRSATGFTGQVYNANLGSPIVGAPVHWLAVGV